MTIPMWQRIMLVLLLAAGSFAGWFFYQRGAADRAVADRARQAEIKDAERTMRQFGGGVKINQFYVVPAAISGTGKDRICYGVLNAASVRLEPPVMDVYPSFSRCADAAIKQAGELKLIAVGKDGTEVTEIVSTKRR